MNLDSFNLFREIDRIKKEIQSKRQRRTVIFIDLKDSTKFKIVNGDLKGLERTYLHNEKCSEIITKHKGKIIKYIGDEIMAIFDDDNMLINANKLPPTTSVVF
jgi:class 3 adenylate cyclase